MNEELSQRAEKVRASLARYGQEHLLRFWPTLSPPGKERLLAQLESLDLQLIARLTKGNGLFSVSSLPLERLKPPEVWELSSEGPGVTRRQARKEGERLLREGKVACLCVAGGQGTRLGYPGPKGTLPFGPVSGKSLFEIHCAKIASLGTHFGRTPPLVLMTSHANHDATREFFSAHGNFGLPEVRFMQQGALPAVDDRGKIFLEAPDRVFLSPDGHGGTIKALGRSGILAELLQAGLEHLFYFQVDNPLVKVAEPFFLGAHSLLGSHYSLKVLRKRSPEEKLGLLLRAGRTHYVVEYSDLPGELAAQRDEQGNLRFWAGSPAIHVFALSFLEELLEKKVALPYHAARKKIPYVDSAGTCRQPEKENGIKFETFIFDTVPYAQRLLAVEGVREEEFAPVKSKTGPDSLQEAQRAAVKLAWSYLEARGVRVERDHTGMPARLCEIHPTFALSAEDIPPDIAERLPAQGPVFLA